MKPPTLQQVKDYIHLKGYKYVDAELLFHQYEAVSWTRGKNRIPITKWRAAVSGWNHREKKKTEKTSVHSSIIPCRNCGEPSTGMYGNYARCNKIACIRASGDESTAKQREMVGG